MISIKKAHLRFWYTLVLAANTNEDSTAELVIVTSNGTYVGTPTASEDLKDDILYKTWVATMEEDGISPDPKEINLLTLSNVRKLDSDETFKSLTIYAENVIGISAQGNFDLRFGDDQPK